MSRQEPDPQVRLPALLRLQKAADAREALRQGRWLFVAGIVAAATLIIVATAWILDQERRSDRAVAHTFQNENQLVRVLSLLQDAELGQRGYLLTGDRYYLEPYEAAFRTLNGALQRLADDMSDNPRQNGDLAVLRSLATQKLSELRQTVDRRQAGDAAGALHILESGQGKLLMDGIRDVLARMKAEEERLMDLRVAAAHRSVLRIELTIATLLLLSAGSALAAFGTTLRRARSAEASRDELLSRLERRLMAVMAADVTSYSSLMESDESGTLAKLIAMRDRVDPMIVAHGGRITSTAGDSLLAVFSSALSAVDCAVEMQRADVVVAEEERIVLRVGINVGDVIEQRGDVFGDTVNIAARLESLAEPGGICVSRAVRDHVSKQRRYSFVDIGLQTVKNIVEPVAAYHIRWDL